MSRRLPLLAAALCAGVVLLGGFRWCPAAETVSAEQKIEKALESRTSLEFIETPLQDVVDYLKDFHEIEIQIDKRALDDVGVGTDTPITRNLKNISLRSALNLMLGEHDLTYTIADEVLLITTREEAATRLTTKVYPVADLITRGEVRPGRGFTGGAVADYDSMIELITSTIQPESWDEVGGPGSIAPGTFLGTETLVISQNYQVHHKIAGLLEDLRKVAGKKQPGAKPAAKPPTWDPFEAPPPTAPPPKKSAAAADDPFGD